MRSGQRGPVSALIFAYRMRWKRRRFLLRIWRKRRQITAVTDRTGQIAADDLLCFATMRNEMQRLPHFLAHYRDLGIAHFLIVDNGSDDGTADYLAAQKDVSLWTTQHSYKLARFGMDWVGWLLLKYGSGHWCLTVDADEILTFPYAETRDLHDLTDWLDQQQQRSFGTLMLELYPKGPLNTATYTPGDDPTKTITWFDADNYRHKIHPVYDNLWIQGGVRERMFFAQEPDKSPTLSKTPLVRWHWRDVYVSSTHQLLPRKLNHVFDPERDEKTTGVLLHTKFLPQIIDKSAEEIQRRQHFENSDLYEDYHHALAAGPDLWSQKSVKYNGPTQLAALKLMSKGKWV